MAKIPAVYGYPVKRGSFSGTTNASTGGLTLNSSNTSGIDLDTTSIIGVKITSPNNCYCFLARNASGNNTLRFRTSDDLPLVGTAVAGYLYYVDT